MTVKDKVILVTGAGRGIGAAICRRLGRDGARVIAVARTAAEIEAVVEELRACRSDCLAVPTDLSKPEQIEQLAATIRDDVGQLDVLVNNAGIAWVKPVEQITLADWRALMSVNLDAVFLLTRELLPLFRSQGAGQIINIGSDASIRGIGRMTCYCASKFALRGFTMALREELKGSKIRVNLVMPGPVNTTIIADAADHWEQIQPEAVAELVWQLVALPPTADVWETLVQPGA